MLVETCIHCRFIKLSVSHMVFCHDSDSCDVCMCHRQFRDLLLLVYAILAPVATIVKVNLTT